MSTRTDPRALVWLLIVLVTLAAAALALSSVRDLIAQAVTDHSTVQVPAPPDPAQLQAQLEGLDVAAAASGEGYDRAELFGQDWAPVGACDTRAVVLARDLTDVQHSSREQCRVVGGTLTDPYTGHQIAYEPGTGQIEVDHVVSLYNAWISGAHTWDPQERAAFANDTTNLLAVSAAANQDKGAADASAWTPPDPDAWCGYASVQIATKHTYNLTVTPAEKTSLEALLEHC